MSRATIALIVLYAFAVFGFFCLFVLAAGPY